MQRQRKLEKVLLIRGDPRYHPLRYLFFFRRPENDLILRNGPVTQLQHREFIGISDDANFCPRAVLPDEPEVPVGVGLRDTSLRPQADDRNRHLVTEQYAAIDGPIKLVRVAHVESRLIDGFAPNDRVTMLYDEPGELAVRYAQG